MNASVNVYFESDFNSVFVLCCCLPVPIKQADKTSLKKEKSYRLVLNQQLTNSVADLPILYVRKGSDLVNILCY